MERIEKYFSDPQMPQISKNLLDSVFKKTFDAVFLFDVPNDLLLCAYVMEPLLADIFNVRMVLKDAIDYWLDNLVYAEDRSAADAFITKSLYEEDEPAFERTFDFRVHAKGGQGLLHYTSSLYALKDNVYLFCLKDITAEKHAKGILLRNIELDRCNADSEKYRLASEYAEIAVIEWDFESKAFSASPGYGKYALSKYSPKLIEQHMEELSVVHEEDIPRFLAFCREYDRDKAASETIVRIKTIEGDYRWTKVTVVAYWNEQNEIRKAFGILLDVNDLVQAQSAFTEGKKRFTQVINNILEGVVIFEFAEDRLKTQYVSDKALRFYGIETEDYNEKIAMGKTPDEIIQTRLLSEEEMERLISQGTVSFSRVLPGAASLRYFDAVCSAERNMDSVFYYVIIRETTAEHEARARSEWHQEKYRTICQESDIVTFDYNVFTDELVYSFNLPPHGYREKTLKSFLADIEVVTLFREAQLPEFKNYIKRILNGEEIGEFEILLNLHHHGFEWHSMQLFGVKDETGKVYRIIGKTQSIQKTKDRLAQRLRTDAVVQITLSADALLSAAFSTTTGEKVSIVGEVLPESLAQLQTISQAYEYLKENTHPDDLPGLMTRIFELSLPSSTDMSRKQKYECRLHVNGAAPGEYRWVQITYMYAYNDVTNDNVLYFFVMDIEEEKKHLLQIMEKADLDASTQLLNRAAFERYCGQACSNTKLPRENHAFILLEFKFEDESPGYESIQRTERTAKALADAIRPWAEKEDRLARFSDTKILICVHSLADRAELSDRAETLRQILDQFERESLGISVYMGVTSCRHENEQAYRAAYDRAETALLQAKENGVTQKAVFWDKDGRHTKMPQRKQVFIRTFGFFEVFIDQKPVYFKTKKAQELLAILVDRRGGFVSTDEAISCLWEDEPANKVTRARCRKVALRLKETLDAHGIGDIVEVSEHRRRIVMENIQCDLFDYLSGKPGVSDVFSGNYMLNYSWAETSAAQLSKRYWAL